MGYFNVKIYCLTVKIYCFAVTCNNNLSYFDILFCCNYILFNCNILFCCKKGGYLLWDRKQAVI